MSSANLVSKWCPMANGGSDTRVDNGKSGAAKQANESGSKGKSAKEVTNLEASEEMFMETGDGEIEQVQIRGNSKMIRSEAK